MFSYQSSQIKSSDFLLTVMYFTWKFYYWRCIVGYKHYCAVVHQESFVDLDDHNVYTWSVLQITNRFPILLKCSFTRNERQITTRR
ncbi:hypothetical protein QE152_g36163 [Popillia japonica]|uniref:Uncharacterized protein n=1 Tax=Popillia japonica TaxID=7064 RepID=A0AAW1IDL5_POPJA